MNLSTYKRPNKQSKNRKGYCTYLLWTMVFVHKHICLPLLCVFVASAFVHQNKASELFTCDDMLATSKDCWVVANRCDCDVSASLVGASRCMRNARSKRDSN